MRWAMTMVCLAALATAAGGQGVRLEPPVVAAGARPVLVERGPDPGARGRATGLAFAPNGELLVTTSDDGRLSAWRVDSRILLWTARLWTERGAHSLLAPPVFSHQGDQVAALVAIPGARRAPPVWTARVLVFAAATGAPAWTAEQPVEMPEFARQVVFLPGDRTVRALLAHSSADFGDTTRTVRVPGTPLALAGDGRIASAVLTAGGQPVVRVQRDRERPRSLRPLGAEAWPVDQRDPADRVVFAFSPDGRQLAGASEGWLVVWQVDTGEALGWRSDLAVEALAFSPDGDCLATWQQVSRDRPSRATEVLDPDFSRQVEREAAARRTAQQAERRVAIWSIGQRRRVALLGDHLVVEPAGLAFRNDGRLLAAVGPAGVALYDVTGASPALGLGAAGAADAPDSPARSGSRLTVKQDSGPLLVWDCTTGRLADAVLLHTPAYQLALSPDGRWLAAQDINTIQVGELAWRRTVREFDCPGYVDGLAFSPSGRRLWALTRDPQTSLVVWDAATWRALWRRAALPEHVKQGKPPQVNGQVRRTYGLSRDERRVVYREGETVWCLDAETGNVQAQFTVPAQSLQPGELVWQADGRTLAALDHQGVAKFWSAETGEPITGAERLGELRAEAGRRGAEPLVCLLGTVYTAAGERVAEFRGKQALALGGGRVAVLDGRQPGIDVYDLRGCPDQPPRQLARLLSWDSGADWAAITPGGYYDASPGAGRHLAWKLGEDHYPLDQYERRFRRPDLVRRWLAGEPAPEEAPTPGLAPPVIAFAAPNNGFETNQSGVPVELEAAGVNPIQRVELTVNGGPLSTEVARKLTVAQPQETRLRFKLVVPLPAGQTRARLRAVAVDSQGLVSQPVELVVYARGTRPVQGALFVLAVGIDRYRSPDVPPLRYAAADARSVAELLGRQTAGSLYREVHVRTVLDEQATLSGLTFALRDLKDTAQEEDAVVLFVAGHGFQDAEGRYGFATHDLDLGRPLATSLSWEAFVAALREIRAQRLLVLADTCHAGGLLGQQADPAQLADRLNRDAHRLVFSASRSDERSLGLDKFGHGAFTQALLEALVGAADQAPKDGRISFRELRDFVAQRTTGLTDQRQHPALPFLDGFEPDTILLDALYARGAGG